MIVITGSGFIGTALAEALKEETLVVSSSTQSRVNLALDLAKGDISKLKKLLQGREVTAVIHTAGVTPWSENPDYNLDTAMAVKIVQLCKELAVPRLLYTSGWNVYGPDATVPIGENQPTLPEEPYGKSKLSVEGYFTKNLESTNLIALRLASVYGPGQRSPGLITNLIAAALNGEDIELNAKATARDYIFIDDVVDSICRLVAMDFSEHTVLNIGSGASVSVSSVAEFIQMAVKDLGMEIKVTYKEPLTESPVLDNRLDIAKAQSLGLLKRPVAFKDGLGAYLRWRKHEYIL